MSDLHSFSLFDTILYKAEVPEYLKNKVFMLVCDEYTDQAISNAKKLIDCGANALVAGSFVFKSENPTHTISELSSIIN